MAMRANGHMAGHGGVYRRFWRRAALQHGDHDGRL